MEKTSGKCEVCKKCDHRYKCPKCLIKYCGVLCFKEHRISTCEGTAESVKKQKVESSCEKSSNDLTSHENNLSNINQEQEDTPIESWRVILSPTQLEKLKLDKRVLNVVGDSRFQKVVLAIDQRKDLAHISLRERALIARLENDNDFAAEVEHMLNVVGYTEPNSIFK